MYKYAILSISAILNQFFFFLGHIKCFKILCGSQVEMYETGLSMACLLPDPQQIHNNIIIIITYKYNNKMIKLKIFMRQILYFQSL